MSKIAFLVGHGKSDRGGYDSGAVNGAYHEFNIARHIAKYATEYYNANYNESCTLINADKKYNLNERIQLVNKFDFDFIAEFHLNSHTKPATGTECYYYTGDKTGKKYAQSITKAIAAAFGIRNRGAKGSTYYGIIRKTKPTAVLIETMFINSDDLEHIKTAEGQKKCGQAIARAVAEVRKAKPKQTETANTTDFKPYMVKVVCESLNIRKTPVWADSDICGIITNKGVYTIVAETMCGNTLFGKLKSGAGWISLNKNYVRKL